MNNFFHLKPFCLSRSSADLKIYSCESPMKRRSSNCANFISPWVSQKRSRTENCAMFKEKNFDSIVNDSTRQMKQLLPSMFWNILERQNCFFTFNWIVRSINSSSANWSQKLMLSHLLIIIFTSISPSTLIDLHSLLLENHNCWFDVKEFWAP